MSDRRAARAGLLRSTLGAARAKPVASTILLFFGVSIAVAVWFTTDGLTLGERVLLIALGVLVVVGVGSGYLVDDAVDQGPG